MKSLQTIILITIIPVFLYAQHHHSHDKKDHKQVESLFIAHITTELNLSPSESQTFWPVYNQYRDENDKARKKTRPDISTITTNEEAEIALKTVIENELKRSKLKSKLFSDLTDIISPMQILKLKSAEHSFKKKMFDKMHRHNSNK